MGHGCHTCGEPNRCICESLEKRFEQDQDPYRTPGTIAKPKKSIGTEWRQRLEGAALLKAEQDQKQEEKRKEARSQQIIAELKASLIKSIKDHRCLVMRLEHNESTVSFDKLRNKQYHSSELFKGAAKIVVDYCFANDLDVYSGSIGAEIWVTPKGIPYHLK